jgi:MFS family permease
MQSSRRDQSVMNSRKLIAAILMMSLVQMGTNGIAPILSQIQQAFPDAAPAEIQLLMSFPAAFVVVFSFVTSFLAAKIAYKYLAVSGLIFTAAAGFLAFLFHHDITELFVWAGIMGTGIGLVAPIAPTLINKHFDGYRKQRLLGFQNTFSTMGSMIMTFACGLLASRGWEYGYLVYLIAVPGIIFTSLGVRGDDRETVSGRGKNISGTEQWKGIPVWPEMLIAFFFLLQ